MPNDKPPITLSEFLLHRTKTHDFVIFTDCGWRIGCTWIDHEDLFIQSLNPEMLKRKIIKSTVQLDPFCYNNRIVTVELGET